MFLRAARCEGLPADGHCPKNRCDKSVRNSIYDLMLCPDCLKWRDEQTLAAKAGETATDRLHGTLEPDSERAVAAATAIVTVDSGDNMSSENRRSTTQRKASSESKTITSSDAPTVSVAGGGFRTGPARDRGGVKKSVLADVCAKGIGQNALVSKSEGTELAITGATADGVCDGDAVPTSSQQAKRASKKSGPLSAQATPADSAAVPLCSELLMYANYHRNRATADALKRVLLARFTPDEIADAKRLLVGACRADLEGCPAITDRRASNSCTVVRDGHTDTRTHIC
jgi:hypothetical protein